MTFIAELDEITKRAEETAREEREEGTLVIKRLSEYAEEEVAWLWPGRIARGKINILLGNPDLGKTTIGLDIAARVSTGRAWPDGTACPEGQVLILTAEDGICDTVRKRIRKLRGDPNEIHIVEGRRNVNGLQTFDIERDLRTLETAFKRIQPSLVIIDPLAAYMGDTNSHNDAAVRGLLNPLKDTLERQNVALIAIAHCNKNSQQELMYRMGGSIGLIAAARMAMVVGRHPHNPDRLVMAMFKSNLAARERSLDYMLADGAVTWDANAPDILPEELLQSPNQEEKSAIDEACEWLAALLEEGAVKQQDAVKGARANGISERTLRRAKKRLNVRIRKIGGGSKSFTEWSLSSETPKLANVLVGQVGQLYENTPEHEDEQSRPIVRAEGQKDSFAFTRK